MLSAFHAFSHLILIILCGGTWSPLYRWRNKPGDISSLPKVIQLKSGMVLLIPDRAFLSKFNQISVLEKFKSIFFKIKQYYDYNSVFKFNKIHSLQCIVLWVLTDAESCIHYHSQDTNSSVTPPDSHRLPLCSQTLLFPTPDNDWSFVHP